MYQPAVQQSLSDKTRFFQHSGRADIIHVAYRPDAEHGTLAQGPRRDLVQNFRHQALPPIPACEYIATIESVRSALAQSERTPDEVVLAANKHVSALDLRWRGHATLHIRFGVDQASVRSPNQVARNLFVLSVGTEDRVSILDRDWPQPYAGG